MNRSNDQLDKLSDSELRHRLIQFGFPNMPVTDTTRKILVKKLRNHLNEEKAKLRKETKNATRYSSDEESDIDAVKNKRETLLSGIAPVIRRATTHISRNMPPPQVPVISRRTNAAPMSNRSPTVYVSNNSPIQQNYNKSPRSSAVYLPPPNVPINTDEDSDYMDYRSQATINTRVANNSPLSTSMNYCITPDQTMNSSWVPETYTPSFRGNTNCHDENVHHMNGNNNNNARKDSPYVSDFTRRLLNLRGETLRDSNVMQKKEPVVYQCLGNIRNNRHTVGSNRHSTSDNINRPTDHSISPGTAFSNLLNKLDEQYGVKQTLVPYALVGVFVIFFALLSFMYLTITPDLANTLSESNTNFRYCDDSSDSALATSSYSCIDAGSMDGALELIKFIVPILQNRAEEHRCTDNSKPFSLNAREAIRLAQKKLSHIDIRKTIKDIHNAEYLIEQNPQWNINHVDINGKQLSLNELVQLRDAQSNYYAILNPRLPFTCSIYNKLQKFFFIVGTIGIIVLIGGVIYLGYKYILNYKKSNREMVTYFIEEIINSLIRKAANDPEQNSIVVNHLRDKLIPLNKRNKLEWAWHEAIKYLENNESRVQFEMGMINGEDCKMLKWIDTVATEQIVQRSPVKKWQSPAFDKTNKIINPPTSCLKIRQMFDKFEANDPNLKTIIQDSILEKVGPNCKVYDIQLDKQSCCVYVRCASEKDAGIVHNEINGWWFDKRLVSIKFLRVERYLSRFSKSSAGPTCLYPSNAKNLSMSQCSNTFGVLYGLEDDDDDIENEN